MPLGLLRNGDYAPSYSRNVTIPAARKNTDVSRQGMYASDPGDPGVWGGQRATRCSEAPAHPHPHQHSAAFLNDFVLVGNMRAQVWGELSSRSLTSVRSCWKIYNKSPKTFLRLRSAAGNSFYSHVAVFMASSLLSGSLHALISPLYSAL